LRVTELSFQTDWHGTCTKFIVLGANVTALGMNFEERDTLSRSFGRALRTDEGRNATHSVE